MFSFLSLWSKCKNGQLGTTIKNTYPIIPKVVPIMMYPVTTNPININAAGSEGSKVFQRYQSFAPCSASG